MNKREIAEIKKINKFSSDGCTIDRMCVCYVDAENNIILKDRDAFFSLPEDEIFLSTRGCQARILGGQGAKRASVGMIS